jgi:hypothetical protein
MQVPNRDCGDRPFSARDWVDVTLVAIARAHSWTSPKGVTRAYENHRHGDATVSSDSAGSGTIPIDMPNRM